MRPPAQRRAGAPEHAVGVDRPPRQPIEQAAAAAPEAQMRAGSRQHAGVQQRGLDLQDRAAQVGLCREQRSRGPDAALPASRAGASLTPSPAANGCMWCCTTVRYNTCTAAPGMPETGSPMGSGSRSCAPSAARSRFCRSGMTWWTTAQASTGDHSRLVWPRCTSEAPMCRRWCGSRGRWRRSERRSHRRSPGGPDASRSRRRPLVTRKTLCRKIFGQDRPRCPCVCDRSPRGDPPRCLVRRRRR